MRVLVTGSVDGLGRATAETLLAQGHEVIAHARNTGRAAALQPLVEAGATVVVADFADTAAVRTAIGELAAGPTIDAVIHNAGVYNGPAVLPVNVVAPYVTTALLPGVARHVFLSSGMHRGGRAEALRTADWSGARAGSYSDSKLFVTALMAAVARRRPEVLSNAVDPGWVPTRMGGASAPDSLELGHRTQEWLATSDDPDASTTGGYWYHRERQRSHPAVHDVGFQGRLVDALSSVTGLTLPG